MTVSCNLTKDIKAGLIGSDMIKPSLVDGWDTIKMTEDQEVPNPVKSINFKKRKALSSTALLPARVVPLKPFWNAFIKCNLTLEERFQEVQTAY